jgi:hypothetical protein
MPKASETSTRIQSRHLPPRSDAMSAKRKKTAPKVISRNMANGCRASKIAISASKTGISATRSTNEVSLAIHSRIRKARCDPHWALSLDLHDFEQNALRPYYRVVNDLMPREPEIDYHLPDCWGLRPARWLADKVKEFYLVPRRRNRAQNSAIMELAPVSSCFCDAMS